MSATDAGRGTLSGTDERDDAGGATPRGALLRRLLLLLLPLALVGPSLLPGQRFLPLAPVCFEPLSLEHPAAAEAAWEGANRWTIDRLFPTLSDEFAVRDAWSSGELPLWDPSAGLGAPLAGGSMTGTWYPPRLLWAWLPPDLAAGWHALLAVFLAGLGMQCFLDRRGASPAAATLGALALQASAFVAVQLHLSMKFDAALWLPWALWAADGVVMRRRGSGPALAAALGLSALAGFVPITVFVATTTVAWLAARCVFDRRADSAPRGRVALVGVAACALAVGVSAVQLVPMREASANSLRGSADAEVIATGRVPAAAALTLVAPKLFGSPTEDRYAPALGAVWWFTGEDDADLAQRAVPLEWNLGAGVLIALLAAAGLAGAGRAALFPGVAALYWLCFVHGLPPASWTYGSPGFDLGSPTRAGAVLWVLWPWLAALGFDALREGRVTARRAALVAAAICVALGGAWWLRVDAARFQDDLYAELPARLDVEEDVVRAVMPPEALAGDAARVRGQGVQLLVLALAGGALVVVASRRRAVVGFGALLAVEALLLAPHHLAPRDLGGLAFLPESRHMDAVRRTADGGRLLRHDASESGFGEVFHLARPNLPQLYGVADLSSYRVFTPGWQVDLLALVDPRSPYLTGASRISDPELLDHRLLDRMGVDVVLSQHALDQECLRETDAAPAWHVYRRHGSLPRAHVVTQLEYVSSDEVALQLLATHSLDPTKTATMVTDGPGGAPREDTAPVGRGPSLVGRTTWSRPDPNRFHVTVAGSPGGWLVVREGWYPGWTATVNGAETPVLRVDHAFRAVRVPAGDARVEFVYRPRSFLVGAVMSALSALLALAWWFLGKRGAA